NSFRKSLKEKKLNTICTVYSICSSVFCRFQYSSSHFVLFVCFQRRNIVSGEVEPTYEECEWQSDHDDEETFLFQEDLKKKAAIEEKTEDANEEKPKGIPEFWLTIFRSVDMLSDMLQEHDEPILKHLQDIKVIFSGPDQPMTFTLEFHFDPNKYFTNTVLTKVYKMKSEPDAEDPFSFEGPEIIDCEGCEIDWLKGKDVTVKTIKKKQKHKGRGTARVITKQVPNDSFFNFFNPIKVLSFKCFHTVGLLFCMKSPIFFFF
uniref:Nucleosome assembly protein 1-like 4b n=1 Tax=Sinocyclocheilus rhinocerous TaxID=307959 RepID=A0A673FQZ6_9TELE